MSQVMQFSAGSKAVTTTAAVITATAERVKSVLFTNTGASNVWIGPSNVSAAAGAEIGARVDSGGGTLSITADEAAAIGLHGGGSDKEIDLADIWADSVSGTNNLTWLTTK